MKKDLKRYVTVFVVLMAVLFIIGCKDEGNPVNPADLGDPIAHVTFNLGYAGAPSIPQIRVEKGLAAGYRWPADPIRSMGYTFEGWFNGTAKYTAETIIRDDVTVTARWIDEFRLQDQPSAEALAALFSTASGFPANLSDTWKIWGHHNALITHGFGADPTAMVYNDRLYIFSSNDSLMYNASGSVIQMDYAAGIQGIRALSSEDMVNWTDHGVINIVGVKSTNPLIPDSTPIISPYKYASGSWAPSATWKMLGGSPKFFIYYANGGNGIGVISANSPTGPWTSPIDRLLIDRDTPNAGNVAYLFDPGVMVDDDDGQGYLFFGGGPPNNDNTGQARRIKLGHDMISLIGTPETWYVPFLFEDNEIAKINGRYYYSYVTNSGGSKPSGLSGSTQIAYMVSDNPMGPYPAAGGSGYAAPRGIMAAPSSQLGTSDENNHHCLFEYKGKLYITHHASTVSRAMGLGSLRFRSTHINNASIDGSGVISTVTMSRSGVDQTGNFNPYVLNEAESMGNQGGIYTRAVEAAGNGMVVTSIDTADWVGVHSVDFGSTGAKKFTARIRTPETPADYTGAIELRIDPARGGTSSDTVNLDGGTNRAWISGGAVIGRLQINARGGEAGKFSTVTIDLDDTVTGVHDLVFVFYSSLGAKPISTGTAGNFLASQHKDGFEFDQWQFFE